MFHVTKHSALAPSPKNTRLPHISGAASEPQSGEKPRSGSAGSMNARPQANVRRVTRMLS